MILEGTQCVFLDFYVLNTEDDDNSSNVSGTKDHYGTLINRYPDAP